MASASTNLADAAGTCSMPTSTASLACRHSWCGSPTSHVRLSIPAHGVTAWISRRSEEHTSELQSLMRISYAVFCLKKKRQLQKTTPECTNLVQDYAYTTN